MKASSIKSSLPRLAKITILLLIVLILPANLWVQLYAQHEIQRQGAEELFSQLKQLIETKNAELEEDKEEFSQKCIQAADIAAYCIERRPEIMESPEAARELADKLDVDEIHCFTPDGVLFAGTHPEYYGYTFESGEQMRYFLPMLKDRNLKLCQEIMMNTSEGRQMQYAAAWEEDGSGIVQIGMDPGRILDAMEENSLESIIAEIPLDMRGYVYAVDLNTKRITASTDHSMVGADVSSDFIEQKNIGFKRDFHYWFQGKKYCVYTEQYGEMLLVRCYLAEDSVRSTLISTLMVLIYLILTAVAVIGGIIWYLNRNLVKNLMKIMDELKKVEKGDFQNITLKTNVKEFDDLICYLNQMLKSIRLGWDKLTRVMDKGRIPIGIFEKNQFIGKTFINSCLLEILGMKGGKEDTSEVSAVLEKKLEAALECAVDLEEQIYVYNRDGEEIYLKIEKQTDDQSVTYYVTDMSPWWKEINELREQSVKDSLTGLYNRRGFNDRLEELFAHPESLGYGAVVMIDADGLKHINDIYGHSAGDEYLKRISSIIAETDAPGVVCARLGGDEFIMFFYGCDSQTCIDKVCGALKARRGEAFANHGETEFVEFSMGYAAYPLDGQNYHRLMHKADERMYLEKRERKALYGGGYKIKRYRDTSGLLRAVRENGEVFG